MKTFISKTKIVALALLTIFTTTVANATPVSDEKTKPEAVRYVGNLNDLPVYRLSLNTEKSAVYRVSIKDESGNVIYSEKVSGASIVRNYQLDEAPAADYSLTFEVKNLTENTSTVYSINKTKKIFDEVAVNEVK